MKIMVKTTVAYLLFLAISARPVSAADTWHTSTLLSVYPWQDGKVGLRFHQDSSACSAADHVHFIQVNQEAVTAEAAKNMYAAILLAKATGASVTIFFDSGSTACYIRRLIVQ